MGEGADDPEDADALGENDVDRIFLKFREGVREQVPADDIAVHFDLGVAYREMGKLSWAEEEFALVLKVDPTHVAARAKLELIRRENDSDGGGPTGRG